ncbi:Delta(24)-sterol C-methyltransferase [Lunasporangiospora selenospora]|uniref:Sterol 24-C-methyltransferase n=1 Tax=Lunasporangiospora selenospora TaxID=979761 RepID=A0A9P6G0W9_9FUNG|nr:Delta(24)-sterol C-methyltransferase [Lunasporangiospora selenospora]
MAPVTVPAVDANRQNHNDLALSKTLHGTSWNEEHHRDSFVSKLNKKDRSYQSTVVGDYLLNWKSETTQDETEQEKNERVDAYKTVANSFYDLATDFYEYAWGTSFHFCRFHPGEPFQKAIARHEHYLAANMQIQAHHRVLDIGSGVGGPAREIGHFTGAHVTGLNNNDYQISRAKRYAILSDLEKKSEFFKGDFMKMPFEDNTFDRCYAIEATVHASSLEGVYGEAFRVLKPGGVFGCYEWLMTDKYDPNNPEHQRIVRGIEIGNGVSKLVTIKECIQALENVGFIIERAEDRTQNSDKIKWYYPLAGDIRSANTFWDYVTVLRTTTPGRAITTFMVRVLEKLRIAAPGSSKVGEILQQGADAILESGELQIFTPMFLFIARKPAV